MRLDRGHGSPYDRGAADSYYCRPFRPHFFTDATYASDEIEERFMTKQQILEYTAGFNDNEASGNFKDFF